MIYAGTEGVIKKASLPDPCNINLYNAGESVTKTLLKLPETLDEAISLAKENDIVKEYLPAVIMTAYEKQKNKPE